MATKNTSTALNLLRASAAITAALSVVQPLLALVFMNLPNAGLTHLHGVLGQGSVVIAAVAAVAAFLWMRESGNKGLFGHAVSVAVLAILQVGLAEMGQVWVHVGLGVAYLLAAVSLFTLAARKPGEVRTA